MKNINNILILILLLLISIINSKNVIDGLKKYDPILKWYINPFICSIRTCLKGKLTHKGLFTFISSKVLIGPADLLFKQFDLICYYKNNKKQNNYKQISLIDTNIYLIFYTCVELETRTFIKR